MRPTRRLRRYGFLCLVVLLAASCAGRSGPVPATPAAHRGPAPPAPVARPHAIASPNGTRSDEYFWLRDDTRKNREILDHLAAENAYADALLAHTRPAQELLFREIVGRIKQDDATVPQRYRGYWYYVRFEESKEYPIHARRKGSLEAPEEILLDGNALAAGKEFFAVGGYDVSLDGRLLAYTADEVGRRQFTLRFKDLETGRLYPEHIGNVQGRIAWAGDHRTVLYVAKDPVTLLGNRVRAHVLGTDPATDATIYEEKDKAFYVGVTRSRSDRLLFIRSSSTVSSEVRFARVGDPKLAFQVLLPRERDHEYDAEDLGDRFIIRTNRKARNFRIVEAPMATAGDRATWRDIIPHREDVLVHDFQAFTDYLVINERVDGLRRIRVRAWRDGHESTIAFDEPTYTTYLDDNPEQDSTVLRFAYGSLTTPQSIFDYDLRTGARTLRKRQPVLGGFDPAHYAEEYVHATAADGTRVPVSLVYRKGFRRDGTAPLLQYGYGSYGMSSDPHLNIAWLSLLDRGFVVAIAHVRGGQELGRRWYDDGRLLHKKNTFTDFIAVTDYLVAQRYAAADKVVALGGSAGGLLMGAIANLAPEKYRAIIAAVPFVDIVTTMLDESIPLTTNEFDEWGNPKEKRYYDYMLSYSPYDNVAKRPYPAVFVSTGLWDSQVQYWEPAKWVARLRAHTTSAHPIVLHVNMEAGHGGKSGRFRRYRETAMEYAFVLDQLGLPVKPR